jgi:predicted CXXCH cytochrome family protein
MCYSCHDRKQMQGEVVHGAMKKGCVSCHDPHGSDGPKLLKQTSIENMCITCHADMSKHFHPTTSKKNDSTGRPLTCTSCHSPHAAPFEGLLLHDAKRDLCVQCHDPSMAPPGGGGHGAPRPAPAPVPTPTPTPAKGAGGGTDKK